MGNLQAQLRSRDKAQLYNHLSLNEGAYFYLKGDAVIDKNAINELFNSVLYGIDAKVWTVIKRKMESIGNNRTATCSLLIYESTSKPTFLDFEGDDFPNNMDEKKFSYLLITEIEEYVVIFKKNISHISRFLNTLEPIDGNSLGGVLVENNTAFQQLKLTSMNMNDNAVRNKTYEANNLEYSMPMFGADQNIIQTARFVTNDGTCTLNINTSRLSKIGKKKGLIGVLLWADAIIQALREYRPKNTFLSGFALPITWKSVQDNLRPTSVLFNTFDLQNYIQEQLDDKSIYKKSVKGNYRDVTRLFDTIIKQGTLQWELDQDEKVNRFSCRGLNTQLGITKTKIGIKLWVNKSLGSLYYKKDDEYLRLIDLVNSLGCYSVGFDECTYIYSGKRIYQNANLLTSASSVLDIFEEYERMENVKSEKGDNYTINDTEFKRDTVFSVVEKDIFAKSDILVCDDLGNEWADHIAITGNTISFIHSKCKNEVGLSASNFQEVIGQAIKNIGNLIFEDNSLIRKEKNLNGNWNKTSICKCRKGTPRDFVDRIKELRHNPNMIKEVCLAVDFISKSQLADAFEKLKNGHALKQKFCVLQMLWLLNGFISICKERDLHCRIFCRP